MSHPRFAAPALALGLATPALAACTEPPAVATTAQASLADNGVDWNGVDWNGIDWNGVDWNGIDWNGIDWNGVDWNGIDQAHLDWEALAWTSTGWTGTPWSSIAWSGLDRATVDWNRVDWHGLDWNAAAWGAIAPGIDVATIDWSLVEIRGVWGPPAPAAVTVHSQARPMFLFVRAAYLGAEFPLAVPGPGALRLLATATEANRDAVLYFISKSWQIAYGPGFYLFAGYTTPPPSLPEEPLAMGTPIVVEGHFGLAPSLAGLGPYVEPQARAWTSMVGNLLNDQPLQISLRAAAKAALATTSYERRQYPALDVRAAIGNLIPPPWNPTAAPLVVLMRSRAHMARDQLHLRGACPLEGQRVRACAGGQVWAIDLEQPGPEYGCTNVIVDDVADQGTVAGDCWVDLPAYGLQLTQAAAEVPTVASFARAGLPVPPEP